MNVNCHHLHLSVCLSSSLPLSVLSLSKQFYVVATVQAGVFSVTNCVRAMNIDRRNNVFGGVLKREYILMRMQKIREHLA